MNLALIPARGGSKRIPKKNIKEFCGKPIIAYSIETALSCSFIDKVIVSTDDSEIADIAKNYGAEVPFVRPAKISGDYSTTVEVIAHAVEWSNEQKIELESICCLYATAPFVNCEDLHSGYTKLIENKLDYVLGATSFNSPIQRAFRIDSSGKVSMVNAEHEETRTQDLEEVFHDTGQFYWGSKKAFLEKKPIFSSNTQAVVIPRIRAQDIDTPEDWDLAEILFKINKNK